MNEEIINTRKQKILDFINREDYRPMTIKELASIFQVPKKDRALFDNSINELFKETEIIITSRNKVHSLKGMNLIRGIFHRNARGFGFVVPIDKSNSDIFIPFKNSKGAMHMDEVLCQVLVGMNAKKRCEGEIYKILSNGISEIIGVYEQVKNYGFVVPDDKKICDDIFIPYKNNKRAMTGHKVAVKITKLGVDKKTNPEGKIIDILGYKDEPGVDILAILRQYNIVSEFKPEVLEELEGINDFVTNEELKDREDFRNTLMVTIDGDDSKDLDDAVSLEVLENGNFLLGVHIADVSHYVSINTALEKEAFKRGTSVYVVNKVVPMLPPKLSNGICSLNPNVDRLTLSCVMEIDKSGKVVKHKIYKSVINSNKRMTYNIVNDLLTNENSSYLEDNKEYISMFKNMETLAAILRNNRIKRGAIEFSFSEAKVVVDDNGKAIDIKKYDRNVATGIIEEFMLICNETVAEEYFWLDIPFVYRCHEEPDFEKITRLSNFVNNLGYSLKGKGKQQGSLQKLLSNIENTPEELIISRVILRSLKQARYISSNTSHFGLAAKYYCHFTSPIRRFPDLTIHKIIKANISDGITDKYMNYLNKHIDEICLQCSLTERNAELAEREVTNLKKVEFMQDKVGEEFEGIISSITNWGIYVELPNTVEGMVSVSTLTDDNYVFLEDKIKLVGERTKKIYSLGDKVNVTLVKANTDEKTLDFEFIENLLK